MTNPQPTSNEKTPTKNPAARKTTVNKKSSPKKGTAKKTTTKKAKTTKARTHKYSTSPLPQLPVSPSGPPPSLEEVKSVFKNHLHFGKGEDVVIDLILGITAGNHFQSDPVWLHLISPPSGGKTELLNSLRGLESQPPDPSDTCLFVEDFTPASLISGYDPESNGQQSESEEGEDESKPKPDDPSLLPKMDGKVVVNKDFTQIHNKPHDTRNAVLSILRGCYDGYASRALGNVGLKSFNSSFNFVTGMTPDIEDSWDQNTLGERFLMYRLRIEDEDETEHTKRALLGTNNIPAMREEIQRKVAEFIPAFAGRPAPNIASLIDKTAVLARFLACCRTYVKRNKDGITVRLRPELATRVACQLIRIGQSVALVRGKSEVTEDDFAVMRRVAFDSLPSNRLRFLNVLRFRINEKTRKIIVEDDKPILRSKGNQWLTSHDIHKQAGLMYLSQKTIERQLQDMEALEIVDCKQGDAKNIARKAKHYKLSDKVSKWIDMIGMSPCMNP